ncbi:hypothetical protein NBE98_12150 [Clostridium swellfunianum]|uniref:hypothetical protein n=1 Tax=Clostridium swellfunianum TaxID=1367462 RepID=UPI00202F3491|nr:hypothetical protein [Clostridium swellfunianum]MCM0649127.1 hypothetical protein [Clostridium swellfunianum]
MKIILHFKDGKSSELNPMIAKMLMKVVNINDLINNPSGQKSTIGKFVNIDGLYSVEIVL